MALRKRTFTRNLEDTAGKIGSAVDSVAGTIRDTHKQVVSLSEDALDNASEAMQSASKRLHRLADGLQHKSSHVLHQASMLAMETRHSLHKARLRTRLFIAEKPATAVAIVAGAAFAGGLLLGLRRRK